MIEVLVTNASTVVADDEVRALLPALQTQVSRDLSPIWSGTDAKLFFESAGTAAADRWALVILDDSDQAGALGYHDLTANNQPVGKVFAKSDKDSGEDWGVTASHELCEMLVDPWINLLKFTTHSGQPATTIEEVCDPVEGNSYLIDGRAVSDFVLPAYYGTTEAPKYDHLGVLSAPMTLAPGGYLSLQDAAGNWSQIFGRHVTTHKAIPSLGSRRERLRAGPLRWKASTAI